MCGICGFIGRGDRKLLEKMNNSMRHRGPDDEGYFLDREVGLGHRRLSIIDIAGGHQPKFNEDKTLAIVFNGEIYNYREIQRNLIQKGHRFSSFGDTETILHAFEEYGEKCLDLFNGMFALAIWSTVDRSLFLARDRLGIKPLYYARINDLFLFASEIKTLLQYPSLRRRIDLESLNYFFTFKYTPQSQTLFSQIKKLEPGHFLKYHGGKLIIRKYWDIDFTAKNKKGDFEEEFYQRFKTSVNKRLISEVPLGAYLSGGLDSSFVVGMMNELDKKSLDTFSVGFDNPDYDESFFADLVAQYFKTNHHSFQLKSDSFNILEKVIWHFDEPIADPAAIPTYLLSQLSKKYVTVVLTGEGADELLAGYDKYWQFFYGRNFRFIAPFIYKGICGKNIKCQRLISFLSGKDKIDSYLNFTSVFSSEDKKRLFSPELKKELEPLRGPREFIEPFFKHKANTLEELLYLDLKTWLPSDPLNKVDKMTMAFGLEARVPFLDHELVEFLAKVPWSEKLHFFTGKYLQRKAMSRIIPQRIVKRKKHTFGVPVKMFLDQARIVLSPENIKKRNLFNYDFVKELLNQDLDNSYHQAQFWSLLCFELWCQIFIDNKNSNICN